VTADLLYIDFAPGINREREVGVVLGPLTFFRSREGDQKTTREELKYIISPKVQEEKKGASRLGKFSSPHCIGGG